MRQVQLIDWSASENVATLTELWELDVTTAEIGRRMGITKNAVIGKARRLGLEPRCVSPRARPSLRPVRDYFAEIRPHTCVWPHGHPGTPEFHFCGAERRPDSPYCRSHHLVAHLPTARQQARLADAAD